METCSNCGQSWPRDPALEVACPSCSAGVGEKCKRPSGHPCSIHTKRDKLAMKKVAGYGKCPDASSQAGSDGSMKQATLL